MSAVEASTPRVFLARHGETEWSKIGRYTGTTDLEVLPDGLRQVANMASLSVGPGKMIDPAAIAHVWISPRKRALQTFDALFSFESFSKLKDLVTVTEDIAEWDYGEYEGLKVGEIRQRRNEAGLDAEKPWDIWRDGCPGGESAQQVSNRLDRLIAQIRTIHQTAMQDQKAADVVLVAHGLVLRAFVKRWLGYPLEFPLEMIFSPGTISVLTYKDRNINRPAFNLAPPLTTA